MEDFVGKEREHAVDLGFYFSFEMFGRFDVDFLPGYFKQNHSCVEESGSVS